MHDLACNLQLPQPAVHPIVVLSLFPITPIIQAPDWTAPFELMCDASNYALGAVLAQKIDKLPRVIYYASRTLDAGPIEVLKMKHLNYNKITFIL